MRLSCLKVTSAATSGAICWQIPPASRALDEEALQPLGRDRARPLGRIDPAPARARGPPSRGPWRGSARPSGQVRQCLEHRHGDGVGLLAGRASRRPDAHPPSAARIGGDGRQHVIAQILEMVRLAKERGEIGGDGVAELRELLHVAAQLLAILGEAAQLQRAQAPRQPAVNELALLLREMDAGERLDERAQRLEVLLAEGELPQPPQGGGGAGVPGTCLSGGVQKSSTLPSLAWREGT